MRVIRQKRPFRPFDTFLLRVWKKNVYIKGWYAQVQVGQRAWLVAPNEQAPPLSGTK